ncbi:MAG: cell envelope integrity EipB family protein [Rhodospirillales bacterium]|nr:cell envelope integrity EipB family protein [Rhodospirillales bacterium]MCW8969959.1 cell envelope integrity EipB family protein [Rhodospirillales bacterium]MCW9002782.1 cell envelope integrity EipB family protein [Rhodospirillales bacterium]
MTPPPVTAAVEAAPPPVTRPETSPLTASRGETLTPHRGLYVMRLGSARASSGLAAAEGRMIYSFSRACDGWIADSQSVMTYRYSEGHNLETSWNFSTWESYDGLTFRFNLRQMRNGEVIEIIEGKATLDRLGGKGTASLVQPEEVTFDLPEGTMFPTSHAIELLADAKAGKKGFLRFLFDGASLDGPYEVNAIVGAPLSVEDTAAGAAAQLEAKQGWPVAFAYFPVGSPDSRPTFEMLVHYREDGVAPKIVQDFGDFSLIGSLEKVESLPKPDC